MSPRQLELALRKQRLQIRSASLREELAGQLAVFEPALAVGDRVRAGARWLRGHPEAVAAAAVAMAVARPHAVFRWARRAVFAWRALARVRGWLSAGRSVA
jgi:hypothetical protein